MELPRIDDYEIENQFRDFLDNIGAPIDSSETIYIDGYIHRYHVTGEASYKKSGSYALFNNGEIPAGWARNWRNGETVIWCWDFKNDQRFSPEHRSYFDSEAFRLKQAQEKKERERKEKERADRTAQWCADRIKNILSPAPEDHPYLIAKKIPPYGALLENRGDYAGQNALAIPLTDIHGNIRGLQYVYWDVDHFEKRYQKGVDLHGIFWSIALDILSDSPKDIILLGEGYATMAKIYELTGIPAVAALSCYGLKYVAQSLHQKYPNATIIITADNDKQTERKLDRNPGIDAAQSVVKSGLATGFIFPNFNDNEDGTDWDDFAILHGDDDTRLILDEQIRLARIPPKIKAIEEKSHYVNAHSLISKVFPPVKWAVDGFLPEGLNILAGSPKVGKSLLALHIAVGVAIGGCVLGHIDVVKGEVLYLALEDTERRLQDRLLSSCLVDEDTDLFGLHIFTEIPRQNQGGLEYIRYWLSEHDNTRLVIIDTLQMFRKQLTGKGSMYSEDYDVVAEIKKVADTFAVPFLLIHHLKKGMEGDWLSEISGSLGITGAADTIFSLKRERGSAMGTLHRTGREVEEKDFIMKLDPYGWTLQGEANEFTMPEWKRQILDFLKDNATISPMQLAQVAGIPHNTAKQNLVRLAKEGYIIKKGYGSYGLPDKK